MKSAIVYYSYSGNTREVAGILAEYLRAKAEVDIIELKAVDESANFFGQCKRAFWHKRAELEAVNIDLLKYDLVCIGTPVWAFGPAPAVNTYLDKCSGLCEKQVVLFTTCGSGTGNDRCLDFMQQIFAKKGAEDFKRFSIQQYKVKDKDFVLSQIKKALE
ncbi:MAG: flavodoxin [Candidatus Omnitrophica bacterium]|nr:flavodoxin [Candidatus Omnitrophota bacterium]